MIDTAGNKISNEFKPCDCGLTGGCDYCKIRKWKEGFDIDIKERNKRFFPPEENESLSANGFYKKVRKSNIH